MKFTVSKETLQEGLGRVQAIVPSQVTYRILANVLMEVHEEGVALTTSDLEVTVRAWIDADVETTGATTLPAKRLVNIVRELPDEMLEIEENVEDEVTITCGSIYYRIVSMPDEEYPSPERMEGQHVFEMDQQAFRDVLRKTRYAASTDPSRYYLNGVLLAFENQKLTVVATDGRRLALMEHEMEFPEEAEGRYVLPLKTVGELEKTLSQSGKVEMQASQRMIQFDYGSTRLISKLIEAEYPNYRQVIPESADIRVPMEREQLLSAVRRVALLSGEDERIVNLQLGENRLVIQSSSPEIGEAKETLAIRYEQDPMEVNFSANYLVEPLRVLTSDEIYLELNSEKSPAMIKTDELFLYVLMPVRM